MKNILISFTLLISFFSCKREIVEPNQSQNSSVNYNPIRVTTNKTTEYKFSYNSNNQISFCSTYDTILNESIDGIVKEYACINSTSYEYSQNKISKVNISTRNFDYIILDENLYLYTDNLLNGYLLNENPSTTFYYKNSSNEVSYILNQNEYIDSIVPKVIQNCTSTIPSVCSIDISLPNYRNNQITNKDSIIIKPNQVTIFNGDTITSVEYYESFKINFDMLVLEYLQQKQLSVYLNIYKVYKPLFDKYNIVNKLKPIKRITTTRNSGPKVYNFEYQTNQTSQLTQMSVSNNWDSKVDIYNFEY